MIQKKIKIAIISTIVVFMSSCLTMFDSFMGSCFTMTEKEPIPSPWTPDMVDKAAAKIKPPVDEIVPFYLVDKGPEIDGDFMEWQGLVGAVTKIVVLGSVHDPMDVEASFFLKTDGENLFVYVSVIDDIPNENGLSGSMAWRGDSVEVFLGTDTSTHDKFKIGDNHIRIVPKNMLDPFDYELSINDISKVEKTSAAVIFTETGYEIEASIPLKLLQIQELKEGQNLKCEFQVNDGDNAERDRLVHWMSETDNPWSNPSVWGRGIVVKKEEK